MHQIAFLVTTALVLASEAKSVTSLKGPPCSEGDGLYAVGCSSKYLQCVNNVETEHSCPEGLYFDHLMSRCERRAENYLCKKDNVKNQNFRQKAITVNCIGRLSGDYPLDKNVCNNNYYNCSNGILYMKKCPQNQVYIPTIEKCDYVENCKSSNVKNYIPPISSTTPSQADTEEPIIIASYPAITDAPVTSGYTQSVHKTTPPNYSAFCERLADGNYGLHCENYYFKCYDSETFKQYCPAESVYSILIEQCDYKVNVEGCPEFVSPTPFTFPSWSGKDEPTIVEYKSDKHMNIDYTTITPNNENNKESGRRSQETTHELNQPQLDNRTTAEVLSSSPETTAYPYPVVPEATTVPAENAPVTRAAVERSCTGKADGFYSFGVCTDHYIACFNGYTIPMQCPAQLAFDEARVICDYKMNVPECQNGSGYDQGLTDETTAKASGELPYSNVYGYEETTTAGTTTAETTTVGEDVPSTEGYEPYASAAAYAALYGIESTTDADVPTTTVEYIPEVIETTNTRYVKETTTTEFVPYVEETTTTVVYVPETTETTTVPYVEETTTVGYVPEVTETTTTSYVEETTNNQPALPDRLKSVQEPNKQQPPSL